MDINDLKKDLPYKFKPQTVSEYSATMVAFIDSRIVQDLLDEVVGAANWQDKYMEVKGSVYCSVGIKINDEWVWKSDCGVAGNFEKEKSEASDAFKRAAVKWGVGRFLYSMEPVKLKTTTYKDRKDRNGKLIYHPCDANGNILWSPQDKTRECMRLIGKPATPPAKPAPNKPAKSTNELASWKKLFTALPKMTEHEAKTMSGIWLIIKDNRPKGVDVDVFKYKSSVKLYEHLTYWPTSEEEQEKAIKFFDKENK